MCVLLLYFYFSFSATVQHTVLNIYETSKAVFLFNASKRLMHSTPVDMANLSSSLVQHTFAGISATHTFNNNARNDNNMFSWYSFTNHIWMESWMASPTGTGQHETMTINESLQLLRYNFCDFKDRDLT